MADALGPTVSNVYQDPLLTDISVRYTNTNLIADQVFPVLPVQKRTGVYFKYDKNNLKIANTRRTGTSRANRVDYGLSKIEYGPLTERSLEIAIDNDTMLQYASPLDPLADAALVVTEKVLLERENDLAADLGSTSIVTQNTTLSGTSQWNDYANSTPFNDIQLAITTIKKNGIINPNTLVFGQQVWDWLINHPDLIDRIKFTERGVMTPELVGALFQIDNVFIGDAVNNTAEDGQTDSLGYIWGANVIVMYVTATPGIRTVTAGYHFTLLNGRYIDRWVEQERKANFVRFNDYYDRQYVAVEAMYLIKNAVTGEPA